MFVRLLLVGSIILQSSFTSRLPLGHNYLEQDINSRSWRRELLHQRIIANSEEALLNENEEPAFSTENTRLDEATNANRHPAKKHPLLFDWTASCDECDLDLCETPPANCSTGLMRDACDCCYVCGNLEGTSCDLLGSEFRYGRCSDGLVCHPPLDENIDLVNEGYCACASATVLCGSDGRTYVNPCRLHRARARKPTLNISHEGPCLDVPLVEIPPMNQSAERGSSAVFSCTVSGFPFPWFEWMKDGENVFRPGFGDDITVQIRSGPLIYQVTSWLEIKRIHSNYNGFYTCVAKNRLGETSSTAFLEVIGDDFDVSNNYYVFRGKHYDFKKNVSSGQNNMKEVKVMHKHNARSLPPPNFNEIEQQPQASLNDGEKLELSESNNTENGVSDALLETLEELVKPKEFKDIFFDDDDFTESSDSTKQR